VTYFVAVFHLFNLFLKFFFTQDLSICHKLLGERFTSQINELNQAIVHVFDDDEVLRKYLSPEGLARLFALLGTNSQGIGTSSFAEWVKNVSDDDSLPEDKKTEIDEYIDVLYTTLENTVGQFINNEGSGLYLNQSKINHSCSPNAEITFPFSNNTLQVIAVKDIAAEEEICISYLDECQLSRGRHSRQKYLEENYLFICECDKCNDEVNQPDVTSDEDESEMDTDDE
jgi:SET and MYND domain-containing protein 5